MIAVQMRGDDRYAFIDYQLTFSNANKKNEPLPFTDLHHGALEGITTQRYSIPNPSLQPCLPAKCHRYPVLSRSECVLNPSRHFIISMLQYYLVCVWNALLSGAAGYSAAVY
ncbi:hypothetical protein CDAR_568841 [Caerostris darwini]|uniref:Uncharacterized protein n=1 Tax=Caerostris darwini TaxID=1538125 RepID=A0AAV4MIJ7_9ARAC|nr:hypothetical protein CDAR_568841 [Caerostris darwini]